MPNINDRGMHRLAREVKDQATEAARISKEIADKKKKMLGELQRRGIKKLEFADGVTITFVQAEGVQYDDDAILAELTPAQRRRVLSTPTLDRGLLSQQIQAGRIDQMVLEDNTHIVTNAPYVLVNAPNPEG